MLRYFNVAGADSEGIVGEDHRPETHLIPIILQVELGKRNEIKIFGEDYPNDDGTCIRDYIHVSDLVESHLLALNYLGDNGSNTFNLGKGCGFSVKEAIKAAREVTGHKIPASVEKRRAGDPAVLITSSEKAKELLGWSPKYTNMKEIMTIDLQVERLLQYGVLQGLISPEDQNYARHRKLQVLKKDGTDQPQLPEEHLQSPIEVLRETLNWA